MSVENYDYGTPENQASEKLISFFKTIIGLPGTHNMLHMPDRINNT